VSQLLSLSPRSSLDAADSALHYAIQVDESSLIWRLLEMRPDLIRSVSRTGLTPLRMAIWLSRSPPNLLLIPMTLFKLYPQAATDVDKDRLLQMAVKYGDDYGLDLVMPISTFDRIVAAFKGVRKSCESQLRHVVDAPLSTVLSQDVMGIVDEYLFTMGNEDHLLSIAWRQRWRLGLEQPRKATRHWWSSF